MRFDLSDGLGASKKTENKTWVLQFEDSPQNRPQHVQE